MRLVPAASDHGIVFRRTDVPDGRSVVPARWDNVVDTRLCTVIGNEHGISVGTIEHLMAALRGCGVDNVLVEIDGPEVPVMDGSAMPFVETIEEAGTQVQSAPRRAIRVLKEVQVTDGDKEAVLSPAWGSSFSGQIDYDHPDIGTQRHSVKLVSQNFRHDIADCRTFGFVKDVDALRAAGLALGGSLDNAIVLDDNGVLNPDGLRCHDEFIRHKLLDAIGDLYLAGAPVLGTYHAIRGGHALNNALLHKLFSDREAWERIDLFVDIEESDSRIYEQTSRTGSVSIA